MQIYRLMYSSYKPGKAWKPCYKYTVAILRVTWVYLCLITSSVRLRSSLDFFRNCFSGISAASVCRNSLILLLKKTAVRVYPQTVKLHVVLCHNSSNSRTTLTRWLFELTHHTDSMAAWTHAPHWLDGCIMFWWLLGTGDVWAQFWSSSRWRRLLVKCTMLLIEKIL